MTLMQRAVRSAFNRDLGQRRFPATQLLPVLALIFGMLGPAAGRCAAEGNPAGAVEGEGSKVALEEVTVTATRRTETVQNVPYNIASVGGNALAQAGVTSINNLTQVVAGLETVDTGPNTRGGNSQFSMRGLRTDAPGGQLEDLRSGTVAPVSTYFGETPLFFPLALKDIDRVEVLKGPQGTLYGSGALAGTIRFIPKRPEFDRFDASVDIEGGGTQYSGKANGSMDAMLNVPLAERLAIRVAAGYETLGGFIDAVDLAERSTPGNASSPPALQVPGDPHSGYAIGAVMHDTNWSERWYVRPTFRWKATDTIDAELSYTHQRVAVGDPQIANPRYPGGAFQFDDISGDHNAVINYRSGGQYRHTVDTLEPAQNQLDLVALQVSDDVGAASLSSSTSFSLMQARELFGYVATNFLYNPDGSVASNYFDYFNNYARGNTQNLDVQRDRSFVEEVRLVSTWHEAIDYIVGLYYQAEHFNYKGVTSEPGYTQYLADTGGVGLPRPDGDIFYLQPMATNGFRFEDRAIFGELTWHITPQWQVTGGARVFHQDFTSLGQALDYYFSGTPSVDLDVENHNARTDHILKFNTSYDFTPDLKLYATYSEGFRRGGANAVPLSGSFASVPGILNYTPDKSKNFEVGVKGRLLDGALRYTADAYLIDLDNFQFNSYTGSGFAAVYNGTRARSKGAELELEYQVSRQLSLGLSYAYTEATVTEGFTIYDYANLALTTNPSNPQMLAVASIAAGARLPVTPRNTANAMVNYSVPLGSAAVQLHADVAYRGSAPAYIDSTSQYYWVIPSSIVANTRFTYVSASRWSADLFVNNLTNRIVYSGGYGPIQTLPNLLQERYVGRPRTYGVGLHYKW
jgi:iron complex outermembrane receptor protein